MAATLNISLSPHLKDKETTAGIMYRVVIALLPALLVSFYVFGIKAAVVSLTAVAACVLTEYLLQKYFLKSGITAGDGSAVVTGLLLAFNLPSSIPLWMVIAGSVVAIGIAKMSFGGLGNNPFNPALVGRAFLLASFPAQMTSWPVPGTGLFSLTDATTGATPLGLLKEGLQNGENITRIFAGIPDHTALFLGNIGGCIGEVSAAALLLGALILLWQKIITWHIPLAYGLTLFVFTGVFYLIDPASYADPVFHLLSGGVILGMFFMATDMVTSPMNPKGMLVFGAGAGLLCAVIRLWGSYPEGCSYSILIMNAFVPLINKYFKPARYGREVNFG